MDLLRRILTGSVLPHPVLDWLNGQSLAVDEKFADLSLRTFAYEVLNTVRAQSEPFLIVNSSNPATASIALPAAGSGMVTSVAGSWSAPAPAVAAAPVPLPVVVTVPARRGWESHSASAAHVNGHESKTTKPAAGSGGGARKKIAPVWVAATNDDTAHPAFATPAAAAHPPAATAVTAAPSHPNAWRTVPADIKSAFGKPNHSHSKSKPTAADGPALLPQMNQRRKKAPAAAAAATEPTVLAPSTDAAAAPARRPPSIMIPTADGAAVPTTAVEPTVSASAVVAAAPAVPLTPIATATSEVRALASLYAAVIANKLSPHMATEWLIVMRLLTVPLTAGVTANGALTPPDAGDAVSSALVPPPPPPLVVFRSGVDCVHFACLVIQSLFPVLSAVLGFKIIKLLAPPLSTPAAAASTPEQSLSLASARIASVHPSLAHELATCYNQLAELSAVEAARNVFSEEDWMGLQPAFRPDIDSRHNFRSAAETALYNNRESMRDQFGEMIRTYDSGGKVWRTERKTPTANSPHSGNGGDYNHLYANDQPLTMRHRVRLFFDSLSPANMGWFADLFLTQLLMRCWHGIDDTWLAVAKPTAGVTGSAAAHTQHAHARAHVHTAVQNAQQLEHLQNLNRRLYRQKSSSSNHSQPSRKLVLDTSSSDAFDSSSTTSTGGAIAAGVEDVSGADIAALFPGIQHFFYSFLVEADSFTLNSHLIAALSAKISEFCDIDYSNLHEIAKTFTARVLKLKLLAKFLGFLVFSPHWHTSRVLISAAAASNSSAGAASGPSALTTAIQQAIGVANRSAPFFDINRYLLRCRTDGSLILMLPWCVEYLKLMRDDFVSRSTEYYAATFQHLIAIYRAATLTSNRPASVSLLSTAAASASTGTNQSRSAPPQSVLAAINSSGSVPPSGPFVSSAFSSPPLASAAAPPVAPLLMLQPSSQSGAAAAASGVSRTTVCAVLLLEDLFRLFNVNVSVSGDSAVGGRGSAVPSSDPRASPASFGPFSSPVKPRTASSDGITAAAPASPIAHPLLTSALSQSSRSATPFTAIPPLSGELDNSALLSDFTQKAKLSLLRTPSELQPQPPLLASGNSLIGAITVSGRRLTLDSIPNLCSERVLFHSISDLETIRSALATATFVAPRSIAHRVSSGTAPAPTAASVTSAVPNATKVLRRITPDSPHKSTSTTSAVAKLVAGTSQSSVASGAASASSAASGGTATPRKASMDLGSTLRKHFYTQHDVLARIVPFVVETLVPNAVLAATAWTPPAAATAFAAAANTATVKTAPATPLRVQFDAAIRRYREHLSSLPSPVAGDDSARRPASLPALERQLTDDAIRAATLPALDVAVEYCTARAVPALSALVPAAMTASVVEQAALIAVRYATQSLRKLVQPAVAKELNRVLEAEWKKVQKTALVTSPPAASAATAPTAVVVSSSAVAAPASAPAARVVPPPVRAPIHQLKSAALNLFRLIDKAQTEQQMTAAAPAASVRPTQSDTKTAAPTAPAAVAVDPLNPPDPAQQPNTLLALRDELQTCLRLTQSLLLTESK